MLEQLQRLRIIDFDIIDFDESGESCVNVGRFPAVVRSGRRWGIRFSCVQCSVLRACRPGRPDTGVLGGCGRR